MATLDPDVPAPLAEGEPVELLLARKLTDSTKNNVGRRRKAFKDGGRTSKCTH